MGDDESYLDPISFARTVLEEKVFTVPPTNIIYHSLPGMGIHPSLRGIEKVVLELEAYGYRSNIYLGLITKNGRALKISLRSTLNRNKATAVYHQIESLLESGGYELHLFPPNRAALAQRVE